MYLYLLFHRFGTAAVAIVPFTLLFKILPDVHARWKDVFIGGIITTLLFLAGKYLIGFYFSTANVATTYRAAGSLIVFIIWVYYNIIIILIGAVFTQVYTEKFRSEEHTSELQSRGHLVCRLLLEKKKTKEYKQ